MPETIARLLAQELGQSEHHVQNVIDLLDEGNTIPFIARYRKELHGSMDDTTLRTLEERLQRTANKDFVTNDYSWCSFIFSS